MRSSREAWTPRPGRDGDDRAILGRFPGCLGVEDWGLDSPDEVWGPAAADEGGPVAVDTGGGGGGGRGRLTLAGASGSGRISGTGAPKCPGFGSSDPSDSQTSLLESTEEGQREREVRDPFSNLQHPPGPRRSVGRGKVESSQGQSSHRAT